MKKSRKQFCFEKANVQKHFWNGGVRISKNLLLLRVKKTLAKMVKSASAERWKLNKSLQQPKEYLSKKMADKNRKLYGIFNLPYSQSPFPNSVVALKINRLRNSLVVQWVRLRVPGLHW